MTIVKPLRPQEEIDHLIKKFMLSDEYQNRQAKYVNFCGNTNIRISIHINGIRAYRYYKKKFVFLGYYYSKELATDTEINYGTTPVPFFTYSQLIERGQEVDNYGYVKSDYFTTSMTPKPQEQPDEQIKPHAAVDASNTCSAKKDALKRRLRILDLQIEREKILSELADM